MAFKGSRRILLNAKCTEIKTTFLNKGIRSRTLATYSAVDKAVENCMDQLPALSVFLSYLSDSASQSVCLSEVCFGL